MPDTINVGVLYGGRSAEHDVSILSANNVVNAMDRSRYRPIPIGITREGRWFLGGLSGEPLASASIADGTEVAFLPGGQGRLVMAQAGAQRALPDIRVVFPVLHGPFGEDGAMQGHAEIADVPYVGSGVLSSAASMDKDVTKRLLAAAGMPVARSVTLRRGEQIDIRDIEARLGWPIFVKPARQGSSIGVGKADDADSLGKALDAARLHDDKVLVEEFVEAREIECAVLENPDGSLVVSEPGEIVTAKSHRFYTYEAKYIDPDGALVKVPADVPPAISAAARDLAARVFGMLGCAGMARIDFFLRADGALIVNEVNTIPGFTNISMYAKALATCGISFSELISRLIEHALARGRQAAR